MISVVSYKGLHQISVLRARFPRACPPKRIQPIDPAPKPHNSFNKTSMADARPAQSGKFASASNSQESNETQRPGVKTQPSPNAQRSALCKTIQDMLWTLWKQ